MAMIRLGFRVRQDDAELVLAELLEYSPSGLEERQVGDLVEYCMYGPPGELPDLGEVKAVIGGALVEVVSEEIADDWADRWKEFHKPITIANRLHVRPPWIEKSDDSELIDLEIDPGRAFGTGAHATTKLCLDLLVELTGQLEQEQLGSVLDLGCGSGVLGIAAATLGWGPVHGVDHQPESVESTVTNAQINGVVMTSARVDLLRDGPVSGAKLVFANLLRPLLMVVAADGFIDEQPEYLIASGLLATEADLIAKAFVQTGFVEVNRLELLEWGALLLRRASS